MTTTTVGFRDLRAAAVQQKPDSIPSGAARSQAFPSRLRAKLVDVEGQSFYRVEGYASAVERGYEMWDMFGTYMEVVSKGAFDKTLDANPDVAFLMNHRGITMARTTQPGRLELSADDTGLKAEALVNPKRQDVKDMVLAIEDGDITEMSFAFMITSGTWSPDYSEYRINEVDLDRGDVSAVNYGANPYTSIAARSAEILDALEHLPVGAKRAALERLEVLGRPPQVDEAKDAGAEVRETEATKPAASEPAQSGPSLALIRAQILSHED